MEDITYTLVSINMHEGNEMIPSRYFCDILGFRTGTWWRFYDDNITQFRLMPENVYSVSPYTTSWKKGGNCDEIL